MSSTINHTPLSVKPRRMEFPFSRIRQRYFFDDNLIKSAYMAALSATFPAGEGEFIKSVRAFQDDIDDPELKEQIRGFIGQEAHHSLQHKQFNIALSKLGFDAVRLEKLFEKELERIISKRTKAQRLAFTVCLEHQTAIMAEAVLNNEHIYQGMDPTFKSLMRWHAIEEVEHKSVAFDLYMATVGDRKLLHRVQRIATRLFAWRINRYTLKLIWWSKKLPSWREIVGYYQFIYGKNGLYALIKEDYEAFFKDDFHPWNIQNQHLIDEWREKEYQPEFDKNSEIYKALKESKLEN